MSNSMDANKRNVLKTLFIVFGCFVFSSTWNDVFVASWFFGANVDFNSIFYHFTVFARFSYCCINPLIYVVKYKEFQRGFCRFFLQTVLRGGSRSVDTLIKESVDTVTSSTSESDATK